jgi:hypothetical protein
MTIDEALKAGHKYVRLPIWNEFAYLEVGPVWCRLYDIFHGVNGDGEPIELLTVQVESWNGDEYVPTDREADS